jgi:hypothetical protein
MDVRIKFEGSALPPQSPRQDILTGISGGSVTNLLERIATRHPEVAPLLKDVDKDHELHVFLNSTEIPLDKGTERFVRDGDTLSLFVTRP